MRLRRDVAVLCMFYKIYHNHRHPLHSAVCVPPRRSRLTRAQVAAHGFEVGLSRCGTVQFQRCFVPSVSRLWNGVPGVAFDRSLDCFKCAVNRWLVGCS